MVRLGAARAALQQYVPWYVRMLCVYVPGESSVSTRARRNLSSAAATILYLRDALLVQLPSSPVRVRGPRPAPHGLRTRVRAIWTIASYRYQVFYHTGMVLP